MAHAGKRLNYPQRRGASPPSSGSLQARTKPTPHSPPHVCPVRWPLPSSWRHHPSALPRKHHNPILFLPCAIHHTAIPYVAKTPRVASRALGRCAKLE
ncbi:hypothetical protein P171DRAFT_257916 [Karstenula rhodostoma CBS 690.94]|uniref:Uncharacterized protein n=1 Tax=Karstenula rhodostoma CBS 690.94 TaxID=1392251 RepID=A0A9P4PJS1_9PLEO|nr:hypothetical protein P171DRAFT_257916 [Karstenula rhodostoma CBS 690.94]